MSLVDVCTGCKTTRNHNGSADWQGGDGSWGDACKFCGAPVITCEFEDIDAAYESGQRA